MFRFDKVLGKTVSQASVFEDSYIPFMIKQVIDGFHSTIFAYGQTGSGKTYTMEGYKYMPNEKGIYLPRINEESPDNYGLVQRCSKLLLQEISRVRAETKRKITVNVSFMQIYNERIYDLLNGSMFRKKNTQISFGGP